MNLLFLAFEDEARVVAELAVRFKAEGHSVFVASCDHFNVTHSRGEVFDYYRSVGLSYSEFTNLAGVFEELNRLPPDLPNSAVDWKFLKSFEERYCRRFTLHELAVMDPLLSGAYHHRNIYYQPDNKALFYKYLELLARWMENILLESHLDLIFTVNFQYFIKAAIFAMAESTNIPFLMVSTSRIKDVYLAYDNFSLGTPQRVAADMGRLAARDDPCRDAEEYIAWLRAERRPAYSDFELTKRTINEQMSLRYRLRELVWWVTRYPKAVFTVHKHYRGLLRRNYFLPSYFRSLCALMVGLYRRIMYFRYRELIRTDLPQGPFVFFALHLLPENSVLTLSPTFDEMECIFSLAKALPVDWKVVVKINPNMLASYDTHPNRYYRAIAKFHNVQFVDPRIASGNIILKAAATASISGTVLLEGAVFGKPGFRWGATEFEVVDIIHKFNPAAFQEQLKSRSSENLKYYIQACFNLGMRLDVRLLCAPLSWIFSLTEDAEYSRQLDLLVREIYRSADAYTDS